MRVLAVAVAALVLAGCGSKSSAPPKPSFAKPKPSRFRGTVVPPKKAPSIALHDAAGKPVTLASRRGRYTLVTFLYTHCPDVCPLIAANLNEALREVDAARTHVGVLAVSVDPKGDTPAAVREYTKRMRLVPQFRYLIGTAAQLHPIWAVYHVAAQSPAAGVVSHVTYTVLIDPRGKERLIYDAHVTAAMVVHDLRTLMR